MDEHLISSNSEACLQFIHSKFEYYQNSLTHDQEVCDRLINSVREQACLYPNDNDIFRSISGYDRREFINLLNYFEEEAFKTYEENRICLFKMFQNLFHLHQEFAFNKVLLAERQIAQTFLYRPLLFSNIEKLRFNSEKKHSTSFSNRADIQVFQQKTAAIESNEIDLTKLIRDAYPKNTSDQFKFSRVSEHWQRQQQKSIPTPRKKPVQRTIPCDDALLSGANKRFVLLHNMNTPNAVSIFDTQNDETKEFQWNEGAILSLGHADSNTFYFITSTKIFLYDIIRETLLTQYFLYDTFYKDLLLISDDLSYRTALKRHNQIQSTVFDDYCYYLYTNKEYSQMLIKCSLDNFQQEMNWNLTKKYPQCEYFLGFTVTSNSRITFLVLEGNIYQLLFCDDSQDCHLLNKLRINDAIDLRQIVSTHLSQIPVYPPTTKKKNKSIKYGKQLWFILDIGLNCVHCLIQEDYLTRIVSSKSQCIQSISIFEEKLLLAYNEFSVEIIDLDNYFASLKL